MVKQRDSATVSQLGDVPEIIIERPNGVLKQGSNPRKKTAGGRDFPRNNEAGHQNENNQSQGFGSYQKMAQAIAEGYAATVLILPSAHIGNSIRIEAIDKGQSLKVTVKEIQKEITITQHRIERVAKKSEKHQSTPQSTRLQERAILKREEETSTHTNDVTIRSKTEQSIRRLQQRLKFMMMLIWISMVNILHISLALLVWR